MDQSKLLEQIDACRAGTDDKRDPGLSALADALASGDEVAARLLARVQTADAAIAAAVRDVPVPEGLAERLIERLKAEKGSATVVDAASPRRRVAASRWGRRKWLAWSGVALTAAAACVAFLLFYPWPPEWTSPEAIAQQIQVLYDSEIQYVEENAWTLGAPVNDVFPTELTLPPPTRYRELTIGRHRAIAYDLSPANELPSAKRATLLAIERRVRGLDQAPPENPLSTQGMYIGVWQSETHVYALVVEGKLEDYQRLVVTAYT